MFCYQAVVSCCCLRTTTALMNSQTLHFDCCCASSHFSAMCDVCVMCDSLVVLPCSSQLCACPHAALISTSYVSFWLLTCVSAACASHLLLLLPAIPAGYAAVGYNGSVFFSTGFVWARVKNVTLCPTGFYCVGGDPTTDAAAQPAACGTGTTTAVAGASDASQCNGE